ncbi:GM19061 [Drosophila sechellia]|uniref:GM19061 n=1 Tax=Drosophila sechellia TaxID=7238 RepID=B4HX47_DROSE|nr:GM19061 [Drosophila sechellia]
MDPKLGAYANASATTDHLQPDLRSASGVRKRLGGQLAAGGAAPGTAAHQPRS